MNTILLAYDDSVSGEAALERAAEMTARLDANLIVVTVAPTLVSVGHGGGLDPIDSVARRDWMLEGAQIYLAKRGVEAHYVLSIGHPADAIINVAKEYDADLIIVGRRSTNPVKRLLGESVSESVLHKAHCTVLLAHASTNDTIDQTTPTSSWHASDSLPKSWSR